MKPLRKISRKSLETKIDQKDLKEFYKMLLKFEKRHPQFSAQNVLLRLYPNIDFNFF